MGRLRLGHLPLAVGLVTCLDGEVLIFGYRPNGFSGLAMWKLAALGVVEAVMALWLKLQVYLDCTALSPGFFEAVQCCSIVNSWCGETLFNSVIVFSSW